MTQLRFDKYEGLGNDFLVFEGRGDRLPAVDQVKALCDRHFGVGGDGVLLVTPPVSAGARACMIVINADGSRPEMCGNGLRCVALHLARRAGEVSSEFLVDTDAGPLNCTVQVDASGHTGEVTLGLGRGEVIGTLDVPEGRRSRRFVHVTIGNPHAVLFDAEHDAAAIDALAPQVSARVPGGLNVEFVRQQGPRAFDLVVHERGVGRTLACGTGAGAVAVAAVHQGLAPAGEPLHITLPGGPLVLSVTRDDHAVTMTGPARAVFSGEVTLS